MSDDTVIQSRAEFYAMLDDAIADVEKRCNQPGLAEAFWGPTLRQLRAMRQWTAEGRSPRPAERESIEVGHFAVRELPDDDPVKDKLIFLYEYFTEAA